MGILASTFRAGNLNPTANPRDAWVDDHVRELDPDPDDYRPTAGADYIPTPAELAEAAELLNDSDDFGPPDADWDALAVAAYALDVVCSGLPWL